MVNIQIRRIEAKLREMYADKIDFSDSPDKIEQLLPTRTLAAVALMMKCGIDTTTSSSCVTDGYHDMGIDAIYLDEAQKQLFLVQSKWRESGQGSISQEEMHTFVEGISRILNLDIDGANPKIQRRKEDIDFALTQIDYQIHAIYIHTGNAKLNKYASRPIAKLLKSTNDEVSTLLVFNEIICSDVYNFLSQGLDIDSIILDDVILQNWGRISTPYNAYYGTISAAAIGEWYKTYGNALFAKNIRFYKGNTDVNEGMCRVLIEEPENFIYYNNGIKLLCKSIRRKAKECTDTTTGLFVLKGVSLVNGAQTTGSVGKAYLQNPEQVAKASVMLQLIDLSQAPESTASQITKLSNTQNRIDNRDFASMDPVQETLRQEMSFSHFSYLYKSGDQMTDPTSQLTFDEAIVALACSYQDVSYSTLAKRNIGALSDDITKAPYTALMNTRTNSFSVINAVQIVRRIDSYLLRKKAEIEGKERLVVVHGNRFIEYRILQMAKNKEGFSDSVMKIDEIMEEFIQEVNNLIPKITEIVNQQFPESYPANIFKNAKKCKIINENI